MDISRSWAIICNILFLHPGIAIGIFGFLAISNAFVMRYSLDWVQWNNATVQHSQQSKVFNFNSKIFHQKRCCHEGTAKILKRENCNVKSNQDFPEKSWGYIHSDQLRIWMMLSFYVGYALSHLPGFVLVERYGGKWMSVVGLTLTAILTVITPYVVDFYGVRGLICIPLLMGLSEGPLFPALISLTSQELRNVHSGTLEGALFLNAGHIGILFINIISTALAPFMEWPIISYFLGSCAALWFISFLAFFLNDPESNKHIADEESPYPPHNIESGNSSSSHLSDSFETWSHFLYNPTMCALISAIIQHEWTQYQISTELHRLMDDLRDYNIWNNYYSCWKMLIPFFMSWLLVVMADVLANVMVMCNILNITEARNLRNLIASFGPKICSDFVTCLMSTESNSVITALNCTIGVVSTYYMGMKINSLDINNHYTSTLMNLANDIGSVMTIMAPYMQLLSRQEGPLENVRSLIWLICTLFSSENIQTIDEPILHME